MPLKKPLNPVVPNDLRKIPRTFAWIDHRLRTEQFLADFEPEEFAMYLFLACAADEKGLSCWRLDVMEKAMPAFRVSQLHHARKALIQKHLLAFRPWNSSDPDGVYQLLSVPSVKPTTDYDTQTFLANLFKPVS